MNELELQKAKGKSLAQHFAKAASHHEKMADNHEKCAKAHGGAADHHEKCMGKDMEMASGGSDLKQHHKAKAAFHKTMESNHEKAAKLHKAHAEHLHSMGKVAELSGEDTKNKPSDEVKAAFSELGIEILDTPETPEDATTATPVTATPVTATTATTTTVPVVTTSSDLIGDSSMSTKDTQKSTTATPANSAPTMATTLAAAAATAAFGNGDNPEQAVLYKQFHEGLQAALKQGLVEALANPDFKKTVQEQIGNMLLGELNKQSLAPTPVKTFAVPRTQQATQESIASGVTPRLSGIEGLDPALADLISMGN
jgi:hypothetical protein